MRPITISDLCDLTGYSRDQMRGLLAEIHRFARRPTEARVARVYSNHDAILVVLLCRLETMYGLKRSVVAGMCEPIAEALLVPREVSKNACLVLRVQDATCEYFDPPPQIDDGLTVALSPIFLAVDTYLLPTPLVQREIGLSATGTRHKANRATSVADRQEHPQERLSLKRHQGRPNHG